MCLYLGCYGIAWIRPFAQVRCGRLYYLWQPKKPGCPDQQPKNTESTETCQVWSPKARVSSDVRFEYQEDIGIALGNFDENGDPDIFISVVQDDQVWFNDGKSGFVYDEFKKLYDGIAD